MESRMKSGMSHKRAAPLWYEESVVDGVKVRASYMSANDVEVTEEEALAYVRRGRVSYPCGRIDQIHLLVDGDEVEIGCRLEPLGLDRIPRITEEFKDSGYAENDDRPKIRDEQEHM